MHVCVFIFRQAQGKGSAHRERHGDGLARGGGGNSGAWQLGLPFTGAATRMALPVSLQGTLLTPHPGGPALSVGLLHAAGEGLSVSALDVREACMPVNFGGCLGRMDVQDVQCADTEERCLWTRSSTPSHPPKFRVARMASA